MSEKLPLLYKEKKRLKTEHVSWFEARRRGKATSQYYDQLNRLTELYAEDQNLVQGKTIPIGVEKSMDRLLARLSVSLNLVLLFANLAAAILSRSLSIISTFIDSLMDVTSGAILGVCLWLIHNTNSFNYPRGRARLELLGVVLCSIVMGIANMTIIMQSITAIINNQVNPNMTLPTLVIMFGGSAIKAALMIACYNRGTSSAKVLAMDMRNDIATSLVAVTAAIVAENYWLYADPVGAILVCGLIAISWFRHAMEHVPQLIGVRAERENLSRILKVVIDHDPRIKCVDHIMVYHTGADAIVEVHIVMDEDLPLRVTHDISHPLEKKLQLLEFVERAFVHCDYVCDGD